MDLADRQKLAEEIERVERALVSARGVLVQGPTGSGRGQIFEALKRRADVVAVEAPPLSDADAPVHPLFVAAAALGEGALDSVADARPLRERAAELASRVHRAGKLLVLRLPASWKNALGARFETDPDRRLFADRAREVLAGLADRDEPRLVVLAEPGLALDGLDVVRLRPMRADIAALASSDAWGSYAEHARAFAGAVESAAMPVTPAQARLAVGLVALGESPRRVVDALRYGGTVTSSLEVFEKRLLLALRASPRLARGIGRFALARFGLPRAEAIEVAALPEEHTPLITECLAYGNGTIAMHDRVRTALTILAGEGGEVDAAHHEIAGRHRLRDGTSSIVGSPSARDWLERAFHLGLSGALGADEWRTLSLPSRELYWTRGRALSLAKRYDEAALVYAECRNRFPSDDYGQHYFAYNRDRAGIGDAETECAYREAVRISPSNAWWNARLVTFLIARARYIAAREEWSSAIGRVDPDGDGGAWLARHFHRWVVLAWLDAGEVELAREAFDVIPRDAAEEDSRLLELEQRLRDAEEAQRLGYSVYPPGFPVEQRWTAPRLVPARSESGAARIGWYPARVVEADDTRVLLAIGVPPIEPGAQLRTALKDLGMAQWRKAARRDDAPTGYWEVGSYEGGEIQAVPVSGYDVPRLDSPADPLRFARRWAATTSS